MRVRVDVYPDDRANPAPRRLHFDGRHIEIVETIDQWYGADYRYLKVRGDDGGLYILHFNESRDEWALIMYRRAQTNTLRSSAP